MKIGVPSGIGDISWLVSKLVNSEEWKKGDLEIVIADGWPYRAQPYLEMLNVKSSYGNFRFEDIIAFENERKKEFSGRKLLWRDIVEKQAGCYLIEPNWHLEAGKLLSEYLPDLETNYHYELNRPEMSKRVSEIIEPIVRDRGLKWVGISCASYRGAKAWKTWELEQWKELSEIIIKAGYKLVLMGGAWDDLTDNLSYELEDSSFVNLVGKTQFGEACVIHNLLDGYVGFSSGLGIIRTVMRLPTLMLWPEHQQALSTSWADPEDIDNRKYIAKSYVEPRVIGKIVLKQLEQWSSCG